MKRDFLKIFIAIIVTAFFIWSSLDSFNYGYLLTHSNSLSRTNLISTKIWEIGTGITLVGIICSIFHARKKDLNDK